MSLKNKIAVSQLNPVVLEAETLQFDSDIDDENIEQDIDCDNGIVNLCVGSDKYFPVICGDRG